MLISIPSAGKGKQTYINDRYKDLIWSELLIYQ